MATVTYTGVLIGVGATEVSLQRVDEINNPSRTVGAVRHLAGGGRRAVTSPNDEVVVTVAASEVPFSTVEQLRAWRGRVVRVRFGWRPPLWCLLAEIDESTTVTSTMRSRDRAAGIVVTLAATSATAADMG